MSTSSASFDQQVRACLDATLSADDATRRAAEATLKQLFHHEGEWRVGEGRVAKRGRREAAASRCPHVMRTGI
jgi:hypothetical protein